MEKVANSAQVECRVPMEGRTACIRERMTAARIGYRNEQKSDLDKLRKELQALQKENEKLRNEVASMKSK